MMGLGTPNETASYYDLNFASVGVSTESGADYTFLPTDSGGWIRFTAASAVTATIAPYSHVEFRLGMVIMVEQAGVGLVTIAPGAGVTLYGSTGTNGQYSVLRLVNLAKNVWNCTVSGTVDAGGTVTLKQMKQALANDSSVTLYAVNDVIPGDVADPINIQWTSGGMVVPGDALAVLIQATLGYSGAQMTALFAAAALLSP
jgi:hypothetical protein